MGLSVISQAEIVNFANSVRGIQRRFPLVVPFRWVFWACLEHVRQIWAAQVQGVEMPHFVL